MEEDSERTLGMGIDAGGSYTDAIVMDVKTRKVLARAKTPTTHEDLIIGMIKALEDLVVQRQFSNHEVRFVGLSTTLATNSILEGKGGKVGLIGIGWDPGNEWSPGADMVRYIGGGHNVKGRVEQGLEEKALEEAMTAMEGKVEAIVVSSKFSVLNPAHEERARALIREQSSLPVIAAHELSQDLGVRERTVTAVLNGRLLPVIDDFLNDVCFMLSKQRIDAKVMVLRGDGTMMDIDTARTRPVETIMSGPAASALGGKFLSQRDDCIVIDMGSTSTDIVYIRKGLPTVSKEGAVVGDRRTHVKAMDALTIGLGGDSHIHLGKNDVIMVGPKRVVPLSMAALRHPSLKEGLRGRGGNRFLIPHNAKIGKLDVREDHLYAYIRENAPCTIEEVTEANPQMPTASRAVDRLIDYGNVIETGLTPTDLLHVKGRFLPGDEECAYLGLLHEAQSANMAPQQFMDKALNRIVSELGMGVLRKVMIDETGSLEGGKALARLLRTAVGDGYMDLIDVSVNVTVPIVGLGGPAYVFIPPLQDRFGADVFIPMDNDVGNAVGTICSKVSEYSSVTIRPLKSGGYEISSSFHQRIMIKRLHEAIERGKEMVTENAIRRAAAAGAVNISVDVEVDRSNFNNIDGSAEVDRIEVKGRAVGDPMGALF